MEHPFDFFEKIYCINLPERTDRRKECLEEFKKTGIEDKVRFANGVKLGGHVLSGRLGCLLSHKYAIREAKNDKARNILVLEDDIKFEDNCVPVLSRAVESLGNVNWYLFYMGSTIAQDIHPEPLVNHNEGLYKTYGSLTTHAIAYNYIIFDYLLENLPELEDGIDWLMKHESVDGWLARYIQSQGNCYHAKEMIATQRPSFSDVDKNVASFGQNLIEHFNKSKP